MHLEKIRLEKIQNGRLSAIIHFHMADIWSTVLNGQTITINEMWDFRWGCILKKFDLIKFKMAAFLALIYFRMADIW